MLCMSELTPEHIIATARDLRSVDGEHPEYDRALVELTGDLLGVPADDRRDVRRQILGS